MNLLTALPGGPGRHRTPAPGRLTRRYRGELSGPIVHIRHPFGHPYPEAVRDQEIPVPLLDRVRAFLASPPGRRVSEQGRRYASDPRTQQRARALLARLRRR